MPINAIRNVAAQATDNFNCRRMSERRNSSLCMASGGDGSLDISQHDGCAATTGNPVFVATMNIGRNYRRRPRLRATRPIDHNQPSEVQKLQWSQLHGESLTVGF